MTEALQVLQQVFGYSAFREPQEEIIQRVASGKDALVVMPTGGGKSMCYQLPALLRDGTAVVISPLIALMQDQVDALAQLGVQARFLNSSLSPQEAFEVEKAFDNGQLDLLYIAPERLVQQRTLDMFHSVTPALFAIDEAHCVAQWGHDFRSDYLQLNLLHEQFPTVPRIALTATADERTRREIVLRLQLEDAKQFICGFDRPNIQYRISNKQNEKRQLLSFLKNEHSEDCGIVYCLSRKKVESIADWLSGEGFNALPYHAGLSSNKRQRNQQRFLREEGVIIVATIAFGMGVDKPNVRFVAHLDLPKSIEAYYQETGRAGRDGEPATAWMAYGLQDVIKLRQMMEGSQGNEEFKRIEQHRLNSMLGLCEITSCRRHALLQYFDENSAERCGNCDACINPIETWDGTEAAQKALSCVYRSGQRFGVAHIIDVLRGGDTEKIRQWDHDKLSTFGIGKDLDANQWRSVFRQLVARSYLEVDFDAFGALKLSDKCRSILRSEETIFLRKDAKEALRKKPRNKNAKSQYGGLSESDHQLWDALKETRTRLAETQGVPPYVIFHDATLMEMMEYRPLSSSAFLQLNGVGDAKLEKYGSEFLEVIQSFQDPSSGFGHGYGENISL
ncbi:MAG: DNA helicase RecQ [Pseudomonadales bacterium]